MNWKKIENPPYNFNLIMKVIIKVWADFQFFSLFVFFLNFNIKRQWLEGRPNNLPEASVDNIWKKKKKNEITAKYTFLKLVVNSFTPY